MEFTPGPPAWFDWGGTRWYRRSKGGHYANSSGVLLHVAVWERESRMRLPDGHVVHHRDHNPANNDPSNLELVTRADHIRLHDLEEPRGVATLSGLERKHMAVRSWAQREPRNHKCTVCGNAFMSVGQRAMYCSPKCKKAAFNARVKNGERPGAQLPARKCTHCEESFTPDDRRQLYCSPACKQRANDAAKVARNRQRLGIRECGRCGQSFEPARRNQKYCSIACQERHRRQLDRARWAG